LFGELNESVIEWLNCCAPHGVLVTNREFVIRGWNRWLEQHSERSTESVVGRVLFEVFPEIRERHMDSFYHEAINGHTHLLAHRFHEFLIALPATCEKHFSRMQQTARIAPLIEGESIVGTITTIEDVTERTLREQEMARAREEAENANRAKDKLLATLSHDLRTPLSAIIGWAGIIGKRAMEPDIVAKGIRTIESNSRVQLQLIDELLDVSRLESGKVELSVQETNIVEIIHAAIDAVVPSADAKDVRIESDIPSEDNFCFVDPKRVYQIVWNLLSNAVKFTPKGGCVHVFLKFMGDDVQLTVSDSGIGMNPEDLGRVFEPLWQSNNAWGHGGLGLGLSIAKQFVQLHGGSITVQSKGPEKGATFIVTLPVKRAEAAQ